MQSRFGRESGLHVHVRVEERRAAAAEVLGTIHRGVCVAHDIVNAGAIIGKQRDTDAGTDKVIASADVDGHLEGLDDPFAHDPRGVRIGNIAQDHGELIATQPRDRIAFLHAGAQSLRNDGEQLIARAVATLPVVVNWPPVTLKMTAPGVPAVLPRKLSWATLNVFVPMKVGPV